MKKSNDNHLPFRPIGTQLLLEEIEGAERSEGGIILPERQRKPANQGRIIAMGKDVPQNTPIHAIKEAFCEGDIVVFPQYTESMIEFNRKKYMIISCDQVILNDFGWFQRMAREKEKEDKDATQN